MRSARGRYRRAGRWLLISVAAALGALLLVVNALDLFPQEDNLSTLSLIRFGFSALTALVYLAVGSLVWLFARQRGVARWLFGFSLAMMITFANETAGKRQDALLSTITGISSVVALASFAILLLRFPYDYLAALRAGGRGKHRKLARCGRFLLGLYIVAHLIFAGLTSAYALARNVLAYHTPWWLDTTVNYYYALALACILLTIICSYIFSHELRTRQQLLLFVIGVMLACVPIFCLTMVPQALNLPDRYIVDGQWSSLPLLLLPLALGYSILRYQILVFDLYIRRAVAWTAGAVGLIVLSYLVVALSGQVFDGAHLKLEHIISVTATMALLGPLIWWLARLSTERLFFPEFHYYRLHMQRPELLARETFDLNKAAELLLMATIQAFETQEVCLYVLDERTGYFHLAPALEGGQGQGMMRGQLLWQLAGLTQVFGNGSVDVVEAHHPVVQLVAAAQRPLFLHEALDGKRRGPVGLARYLVTSPLDEIDPLLVPVRAQGKMIGILCLGERGDGQMYAGPDFEFIHLLLARFSSMLETARLYVQASRHVAVLNALYSASTRLERTYLQIEEVAAAYAQVAAEAMQAAAEIWLYVPERVALHRIIHAGQGPVLLPQEWLSQLQEQDWSSCFQEGNGQNNLMIRPGQVPACLSHLSGTPFAWLPLCKGQRRLGVLMLSFAHPHVFSLEEKRILGMFARQCAAAMENAQITIALRAAYERQKELDQFKDQFIMTASHELRTPLTAVQGYIELLSQYNDELSAETRTEFIQKAHRGCDELALLVGNIMDASRLQIEGERIRLTAVELISSVRHVMEILEAVTTREARPVNLAIAPGLYVQADELRLRQILLNLVSNALKYSAAGSAIQILALQGQGLVKISVRDYGLGVPPGEQQRLFERFVRLERDMNSPVRGAGLGLYITRRLVEAMHGRLWVESSGIPGEGSTFSFTLQRAAVAPRQVNATAPLAMNKK
ncbi:MAG TPA: GAF domain-containing sensor histidine kinase [Ktedonobacteraceae bacterium]|nr:GAF domain-containing sensor histidine kinase [Ktedonobacteraceae bacterium]